MRIYNGDAKGNMNSLTAAWSSVDTTSLHFIAILIHAPAVPWYRVTLDWVVTSIRLTFWYLYPDNRNVSNPQGSMSLDLTRA